MSSDSIENREFTETQMKHMLGLYGILRRIHARLATEGYFMADGRTWNPEKTRSPQSSAKLEDES